MCHKMINILTHIRITEVDHTSVFISYIHVKVTRLAKSMI